MPEYREVQLSATLLDWEGLNLDPSVIVENSKRVKDRLLPDTGPVHDEPVAIVAYGSSLRDTWQEIKNYKTIFTCSGSHKFLLERGIVPTYHVETDPQGHKSKMLGAPHPDVTYCVASICHPNYFEHLEKHNATVKLFHLLFLDETTYKYLPSGEWLLTGGNTVGVRAMRIAYLLKHRTQHIFGLDMSGTHAGEHLKAPKNYELFEYAGKTYQITPHNKLQFYGLFTELACYMPDLTYKFFGEGLVQAAMKHFDWGETQKAPNLVMKGEDNG